MRRPVRRALLLFWAAAALALGSCRSSAPPITIHAGWLLDGRGGRQQDALLTIQGDRIVAVGPYQGGTVTHDLSRYTVLPGLIDAHVHIGGYFNRLGKINTPGDGETKAQQFAGGAASALATLRAGFTTVASMGHENDRPLRDAIAAGKLPGPRILTSLSPLADTSLKPRELRQKLRGLKRRHADFVKIFASNAVSSGGFPTFTPGELQELCRDARRLGLRSVVHIQSDASIRVAVEAGCDQLEHGVLATSEGLRLMAERHVLFDPQCRLVMTNYLDNRDRYGGSRGFSPAAFELMERVRRAMPGVLRAALATPGLELLYGTDATAGAHGRNADDLICRVREAGQAPMDALVTATSRNAAGLGLGDRIGTLAPGYQADVIAVEGNPLEEIEALQRVTFVMKGGKVFLP